MALQISTWNLILTGITRVKRAVVLVGEAKAVYVAVDNDKVKARNTRLAERLAGTGVITK